MNPETYHEGVIAAPKCTSPGDAPKSNDRHPCTYVLIAVIVLLLIFPIITIPILFTMFRGKQTTSTYTTVKCIHCHNCFAALKHQSSESHCSYPHLQSATLSSMSSSSLAGGVAVSLSSTGSIQQGGGTTIYKGVGTIPVDKCPKYLSATPIFDDKYLVTFKSSVTSVGTVSVVQIDSSKKSSTVLGSASGKQDLYSVVTLDKANGLFASISQDESQTISSTIVVAGRVDTKTYAITFGAPYNYEFNNPYSFTPSIAALSTTNFAIAFYAGAVQGVYTRFCKKSISTITVMCLTALLNQNLASKIQAWSTPQLWVLLAQHLTCSLTTRITAQTSM